MRFEKHAFNSWYEKQAFYHPLKSLMITYYNTCFKIVFLETYVLVIIIMFYKTPDLHNLCYLTYVKRALMNVVLR